MLYFFLFAVLFMPVFVHFKAYTEKEALKIRADITFFFKIKIYSGSVTVKKVVASIFSGKKKRGNGAQVFNIIKKYTKIKQLEVRANIGTGEAPSTAMLVGGISGVLAPFKVNENCKISIVPEFNDKIFEFFGQCDFKTNLFKSICAILKINGGKRKWKNILLKA